MNGYNLFTTIEDEYCTTLTFHSWYPSKKLAIVGMRELRENGWIVQIYRQYQVYVT